MLTVAPSRWRSPSPSPRSDPSQQAGAAAEPCAVETGLCRLPFCPTCIPQCPQWHPGAWATAEAPFPAPATSPGARRGPAPLSNTSFVRSTCTNKCDQCVFYRLASVLLSRGINPPPPSPVSDQPPTLAAHLLGRNTEPASGSTATVVYCSKAQTLRGFSSEGSASRDSYSNSIGFPNQGTWYWRMPLQLPAGLCPPPVEGFTVRILGVTPLL